MKCSSVLLSLFLSLSFSAVAFAADEPAAPAAPAAPTTPTTPTSSAPEAPAKAEKSKAKDAEKEKEKELAKEKAAQKAAEKAAEKASKESKADSKPKEAEAPPTETLVDLATKHGYSAAWANMFKGEWSIAAWIQNLEANSAPVIETQGVDGHSYILGSMCKSNDCANDRLIAIFNADHKRAWGVQITIPAGVGKDGERHPKKYANLKYYGNPDVNMKKVIAGFLEKDPTWK